MLIENILIEDVFEILYFIGTDVILIFFFSKKEIISASKKNFLDKKFCFLKFFINSKPFKPDCVSPLKFLSMVKHIITLTILLTK